jgi:hypothetical protein
MYKNVSVGKGNIPIEKEFAKRIEDGKIIKELPYVTYDGELVCLFSVVHPTICIECGARLYIDQHWDRYIISSFGILEISVIYWVCSNDGCKTHYHDEIIGVTGSKNYSDEYLDKQFYTRYKGKCSLFNNRTIGEIYTSEDDYNGRAACPATLWKYEQVKGTLSIEELRSTDIDFGGTIHCDGYWVKEGWRKFIEMQLGRKLTNKEWKKLRNKIIYVIATNDKVILDFEITDIQPSYISLIPLFSRVKTRLGEKNIKKVVSDEDSAIIGAVNSVLPDATHSFCVFHQLKNLTKLYLDDFKTLDKLPYWDKKFYEMAQELILADNTILSTIKLQELRSMLKDQYLTTTSENAMKFIEEAYKKNKKILMSGFVPETNNVMEQLFSFINDFVYQIKSFKIRSGLKNWAANMFSIWNTREFNTGNFRGLSPLDISEYKYSGIS